MTAGTIFSILILLIIIIGFFSGGNDDDKNDKGGGQHSDFKKNIRESGVGVGGCIG